jgi:hypothetical protein
VYIGDGPEFYGRPWRDLERWRALTNGEVCPICDGDGKPYGIDLAGFLRHVTILVYTTRRLPRGSSRRVAGERGRVRPALAKRVYTASAAK